MARSRKGRAGSQIIDTEKRWKSVCDNCKKLLDEGKDKAAALITKIYVVPRLIFLPESKIPLIIPELNLHLLVCENCVQAHGEPVAVEDRGFFREQKILWNKPEQITEKANTKFCGLCAQEISYNQNKELAEKVGAIYILPRLIYEDGKLVQIETKKSEIRLVICKECVHTHYQPLGVEQTWRFESDIMRPELLSIKKLN